MPTLKTQSPNSKDDTAHLTASWKIKLLYDGQCPLCLREVNFLTRKDAGRGIVAFVDIADLDYRPSDHGGVEFAEAMGRIHAVLPDGTVIRDVEVFRRVYEALGMGWIYAATQWPIVRPIANKLYDLWASWRLALTGRPNLETLLSERQTRLNQGEGGRCRSIPKEGDEIYRRD
ncbi:thiol-disulfide oxidoreductase DCC family protein [Altericista sp. CCNU0014]|uniref:thiol-disulfide oxidoreductase DCC family protein n=1 Tax=Altericista sp. CCNU0014 TaxID=3082949 RepID=UPI00384CF015